MANGRTKDVNRVKSLISELFRTIQPTMETRAEAYWDAKRHGKPEPESVAELEVPHNVEEYALWDTLHRTIKRFTSEDFEYTSRLHRESDPELYDKTAARTFDLLMYGVQVGLTHLDVYQAAEQYKRAVNQLNIYPSSGFVDVTSDFNQSKLPSESTNKSG